jgi:hypothetical protein
VSKVARSTPNTLDALRDDMPSRACDGWSTRVSTTFGDTFLHAAHDIACVVPAADAQRTADMRTAA